MSTPSFAPKPVVLAGAHVRLSPLLQEHAAAVFEAGRDASIWEHLPRAALADLADAEGWVGEALAEQARGESVAFAIHSLASGEFAGSTRILDIRPAHRTLEVGWTWLTPAYQRSAINTEAKLLLLAHAFEALGAERVQFKTDARNLRSQRALERIGAQREGVLRHHMVVRDGYRRDSVFYSVIAPDWPRVRRHIEALLARRA